MPVEARKRVAIWIVVGIATVLTGVLARLTVASATTGCVFKIVNSPSPNPTGDTLLAAASSGSSNIWAVGFKDQENYLNEAQTLIERFNGSRWNVVPSPNPNPGNCSEPGNALTGAAARSKSDAWAVGFSNQNKHGCSQQVPLILHWNG